VKLLKPDVVTEDAVRRFEQEVQLTARLRHPNTIEIYDFGRTPEGIFYYAMEYLEGYDLGRLVELAGPLPPDRVVHILRQACRSLREAHGQGLVHRDIKPMNLIVSAFGGEYDFVKVLDFGLVKDVRVPDAGMTEINVIPGTPPYIAPERMRPGAAVDGRVDIYALGAVAFNLLTGTQVFEGETSLDVAYKTMHEEPRRPSGLVPDSLPESLDDLVLAMLARAAEDRPRDICDLLARLDRIAEEVPWDAGRAAAWWADHPPARRDAPGDARPLRVMDPARRPIR
jgi:serine/threonine-protein kinase